MSKWRLCFFVCMALSFLGCDPKLNPTLDLDLNSADKTYAPGAEIVVSVKVTNFTLSQDNLGKENKEGMGHYRIYLDGQSGDNYTVEGAAAQAKFNLPKDITPGSHVLKVLLYNNDRTELSPRAESTVTFTIKDDGGPSVQVKADKTKLAIGDPLTLTISVKNFKLVAPTAEPVNKEGEGHYHLAFDDDNPEQSYLISGAKESFTFNIPTQTKSGKALTPGKHTLWVYLMESNHEKYRVEVKASVELELTGGTKPTIKVKADKQKLDPGGGMTLDVETTNFNLIEPKAGLANKPGEGHYRVTLDDKDPTTEFLLKGAKARTELILPDAITPGNHSIHVYLVNNDGTKLDPEVKASVQIFINGGVAPKLSIKLDKTEILAGEKANLTVTVENFTLTKISNQPVNKNGEGHYHIVFDDQDPEQAYSGFDYKENTAVTIPAGLAPGKHTLNVYLMNNDHSLAVPTTKASVEITVKSGTEPAVSIEIDKKEVNAGDTLGVTVKAFNFTLTKPGGANQPKTGHYHLVLDDLDPEKDYISNPFAEKTTITLPATLKPGKHILWVYLMNNDHTKISPEVRSSVVFTVKAK